MSIQKDVATISRGLKPGNRLVYDSANDKFKCVKTENVKKLSLDHETSLEAVSIRVKQFVDKHPNADREGTILKAIGKRCKVLRDQGSTLGFFRNFFRRRKITVASQKLGLLASRVGGIQLAAHQKSRPKTEVSQTRVLFNHYAGMLKKEKHVSQGMLTIIEAQIDGAKKNHPMYVQNLYLTVSKIDSKPAKHIKNYIEKNCELPKGMKR